MKPTRNFSTEVCLTDLCDEPDNPSAMQMAKNLISSVKDIAGGMFAGKGVLVTDEQYKERLAICHECPFFNRETTRCSKCGCFMKAKAGFKQTECPIGKWSKIDD